MVEITRQSRDPHPTHRVEKLHGPVNGDECYFWRTTGCSYGPRCFYKHIPGHEGVDLKGYMAPGRK